jgi:hypothetical protein
MGLLYLHIYLPFITYFGCVFVALGIQRTYCYLWLFRLYHIFPDDTKNGTIFEEILLTTVSGF